MSGTASKAQPRRNWLKLKTRLLIDACGGLELASDVCAAECRAYSVKQLSRCQNPNAPDVLPIDILDCLEAHSGRHIVSSAIGANRWRTGTAGELRDESSEVTETAADLQRHIREAMSDGEIDAVEAERLLKIVEAGMGHLADVEACLRPLLKRGV
ncbi:hypothetical protein [Brevundimonas sp.]|uniref:hypothetical protein n=1 Tax=Brevundimonas sp. TaxID=1871086 RepID=UPI00289FC6CC|nr:hypothetical protein [Brevundimonas sp.]